MCVALPQLLMDSYANKLATYLIRCCKHVGIYKPIAQVPVIYGVEIRDIVGITVGVIVTVGVGEGVGVGVGRTTVIFLVDVPVFESKSMAFAEICSEPSVASAGTLQPIQTHLSPTNELPYVVAPIVNSTVEIPFTEKADAVV